MSTTSREAAPAADSLRQCRQELAVARDRLEALSESRAAAERARESLAELALNVDAILTRAEWSPRGLRGILKRRLIKTAASPQEAADAKRLRKSRLFDGSGTSAPTPRSRRPASARLCTTCATEPRKARTQVRSSAPATTPAASSDRADGATRCSTTCELDSERSLPKRPGSGRDGRGRCRFDAEFYATANPPSRPRPTTCSGTSASTDGVSCESRTVTSTSGGTGPTTSTRQPTTSTPWCTTSASAGRKVCHPARPRGCRDRSVVCRRTVQPAAPACSPDSTPRATSTRPC